MKRIKLIPDSIKKLDFDTSIHIKMKLHYFKTQSELETKSTKNVVYFFLPHNQEQAAVASPGTQQDGPVGH